jgi:ABC-type Mn2+/Zn2+ transport system permease subunit
LFDVETFWELAPIMIVVAATCALPGLFLLLRRMTLVADAMSHV